MLSKEGIEAIIFSSLQYLVYRGMLPLKTEVVISYLA